MRSLAPLPEEPKRVYGCLVVYGSAYLALLRKIWIPNFVQILKTTNPEILKKMILCVYCRKAELAKVRACFGQVEKTNQFRVEYFPLVRPPRSSNQYPEMNRMHQDCLQRASLHDAPVFFFFPDQVLSQNCLNFGWDLLKKGIRLCQFPSVRVNLDPTLRRIMAGIKRTPAKVFAPRVLADLALRNLHNLCTGLFWEKFSQEKFPCSPYAIIHRISANCLLFHGLHNYVFFARPEQKLVHARSIDVDFIQDGFPDKNSVYMVEDSDQMMAFDLSANRRMHPCTLPSISHKARIQQILCNLNLFKERHLQTSASPAIIHAKELTRGDRDSIRKKSVLLAPFLCKAIYKLKKTQKINRPVLKISTAVSNLFKIQKNEKEPISYYPDKEFYLNSNVRYKLFRFSALSTLKIFRSISGTSNRAMKVRYARMVLAKYENSQEYKKMLILLSFEKYIYWISRLIKNIAQFVHFRTRNPFYDLNFYLPKKIHRYFLSRLRVQRFLDA